MHSWYFTILTVFVGHGRVWTYFLKTLASNVSLVESIFNYYSLIILSLSFYSCYWKNYVSSIENKIRVLIFIDDLWTMSKQIAAPTDDFLALLKHTLTSSTRRSIKRTMFLPPMVHVGTDVLNVSKVLIKLLKKYTTVFWRVYKIIRMVVVIKTEEILEVNNIRFFF